MIATVKAPGSCGELVQGTIDGRNFLITCPIDMLSEVTVDPAGTKINAGVKTVEAVRRTWARLGIQAAGFGVEVRSALPQGKGMASSTADISAACLAAALAAGRTLDERDIAEIALSIEPTDGIFLPGIVMFDHLRGLTRRPLGAPPPMTLVVFDAGGEIDTLRFNSRADLAGLNRAKEAQVREAADLVSRGIAAGDCDLIGQGATLSAVANQRILFKAALPQVLDVALDFGAVGVNAAHSGTVMGLMFAGRPDSELLEDCVATVRVKCPELDYIGTVGLISGGLSIAEG